MDMGSSTEKGLFTPASPVSPFGGRGDPALGHQFVKVGRGVADILQAFKPALAAERQIGLLLLFNRYFYGGHKCHRDSAIPRMVRVLAGIRILEAVPSFVVMSGRVAGGVRFPSVERPFP